MAKLRNTHYKTKEYGELSTKALLERTKRTAKYSRRYRCHDISVNVTLAGCNIKIFFCRRSKNDGWKVLLTTDVKLDFMRAHQIYAMRWAIEVFFSDSKRILGLADCSARDFSSQIAHISLVMIRYNLFASIKDL